MFIHARRLSSLIKGQMRLSLSSLPPSRHETEAGLETVSNTEAEGMMCSNQLAALCSSKGIPVPLFLEAQPARKSLLGVPSAIHCHGSN